MHKEKYPLRGGSCELQRAGRTKTVAGTVSKKAENPQSPRAPSTGPLYVKQKIVGPRETSIRLQSTYRALDTIIRGHFFDFMASVVLPGFEDVTQSDVPGNFGTNA